MSFFFPLPKDVICETVWTWHTLLPFASKSNHMHINYLTIMVVPKNLAPLVKLEQLVICILSSFTHGDYNMPILCMYCIQRTNKN